MSIKASKSIQQYMNKYIYIYIKYIITVYIYTFYFSSFSFVARIERSYGFQFILLCPCKLFSSITIGFNTTYIQVEHLKQFLW